MIERGGRKVSSYSSSLRASFFSSVVALVFFRINIWVLGYLGYSSPHPFAYPTFFVSSMDIRLGYFWPCY